MPALSERKIVEVCYAPSHFPLYDNGFDIVVVNCDRNEADFKTHIAKMPQAWYNVPFEATKVME